VSVTEQSQYDICPQLFSGNCLIVAGKLFHTHSPAVLRQQNFSRREWYVCVEQRVFCRKMSGDDDDHAQRRVECRQTGTSVLSTFRDWCARHAVLNSTRLCSAGSQWSWRNTRSDVVSTLCAGEPQRSARDSAGSPAHHAAASCTSPGDTRLKPS